MNTIIPTDSYKSYEEWLAERPACVQALAKKIPPGTIIVSHGERVFVVGYYEGYYEDEGPSRPRAGLYVSDTDPTKDYVKAIDTKETICPCCMDKLDKMELN